MARAFEMVDGAEALFELEGLDKAQHDQQRGHNDQHIRVDKAPERADERDDRAHQGNHKQTQRIELSLEDKRFKTFPLG